MLWQMIKERALSKKKNQPPQKTNQKNPWKCRAEGEKEKEKDTDWSA